MRTIPMGYSIMENERGESREPENASTARSVGFVWQDYVAAFFLPIALLYVSYHFLGSYFETNDDPRYVMAMKGLVTPKPYNNFVSVYRFTSDWYIWLYKHFPTIGWYGWSMFLLLWGALVNLFFALTYYLKGRLHWWGILLVFCAAYFLLFLQNVYWINFTRPALLTTGSSMMLVFAILGSKDYKKEALVFGFAYVVFVLGHLTRLDAGYLVFLFCAMFVLLFSLFGRKSFKRLIYSIAPFAVIILAIQVSDTFTLKTQNHEFLEKTRLIKDYNDYRNFETQGKRQFQNIRDKLAYFAAVEAFYLTDNNVVNIEFLKTLTGNSVFEKDINRERLSKSFKPLYERVVSDCYPLFLLNLIFFLSAALKFDRRNIRDCGWGFAGYILFQLFFVSLIVAMMIFMKLPSRIFSPMFVIFTLCNFIALMESEDHQLTRSSKTAVIVVALIGLVFIPKYVSLTEYLVRDSARFGEVNTHMVDDMNMNFKNTIFIPTAQRAWGECPKLG